MATENPLHLMEAFLRAQSTAAAAMNANLTALRAYEAAARAGDQKAAETAREQALAAYSEQLDTVWNACDLQRRVEATRG